MKTQKSGEALPSQIGRFEVRGFLGAGAAGSVYRVFDPRLAREIALKVAHPGTLQTPRDVERFFREARAAGKLRHPHIVPVYDAGQTEGRHYLTAAFIDGSSLAQAIEAKRLERSEQVAVVRQIGEALAYAHRQRIAHRDVKPSNILLDKDGKGYLTDFGLARREQNKENLTQEGELFGSVAYLAPERIEGKEDNLAAGDQYSLGVVLYECLTGKTPFEGESAALMYQALHNDAPSPRSHDRSIPRDLERIALKALARRIEDRYANCQEFADDLRRWSDGDPVRARPVGFIERSVRWAKREPILAAASGVALLALLAVILVPIVSAIWLAAAVGLQEQARAGAEQAAEEERQAARNAVEEQLRAEAAVQEAVKATADLKLQTKEAEDTRREAKRAAERAQVSRALAEERRKRLPTLQYAADMLRASEDLREADLKRMAARLAPYREDDKANLRGFEWFWLDQLGRTVPELNRFNYQGALKGAKLTWSKTHLVITTPTDTVLIDPEKLSPREEAACETRPHRAPQAKLLVVDPAPEGRRHSLKEFTSSLRMSNGPELLGFEEAPTWVTFSSDGKRLATYHPKPLDPVRVWLWDLDNAKPLLLKGKFGLAPLGLVKLSPRGDVIATTNNDEVQLWNDKDDEPQHRFKVSPVRRLVFRGDAKVLATATPTDVRLWDVQTGKRETVIRPRGTPELVFFSADDKWLITVGLRERDGEVQVWDARTGAALATLEGRTVLPGGIALADDGTLAVLSADGDAVSRYRLPTGATLGTLPLDRKGAVALAFSPDSEQLAILYGDARLQIWKRPLLRPLLLGRSRAAMMALSIAGEKITARDRDGMVRSWEVKDNAVKEGQLVAELYDPALPVAVSKDGRKARFAEGTIEIVSPEGKSVVGLPAGSDVSALAWSSDGRTLVSGHASKKLTFWDVASGKPRLPAFEAHEGVIRALASSPDGKTFVSGGDDGRLRFWHGETGRELLTLEAGLGAVTALAFDDKGTLLVAGGQGRVRLFHAPR